MARPTLLRHRKFSRLARLVGSRLLALGALSMLWEGCYDAGDEHVGTAADIADAIGWPADARCDIASALFDAGFIDRDAERPGEFVVHDLWDHCPEYVAKRRKREIERQARGAKLRANGAEWRTNGGQTATNGDERRESAPRGVTPSPSPIEQDQDPGLSAGVAPCGNVENSSDEVADDDLNQLIAVASGAPFELRKRPRTERVVAALVLDVLRDADGTCGEADLKEDVKRRCARLRIPYDADVVRKALDSAAAQRMRRGEGVTHGAMA